MLKVTRMDEDDKTVTLKIEGRIAGPWVYELKRECENCLARQRQLIFDLSGVNFIDHAGAKVLKSMMIGDRVQLTGCSLFLSELLKEDRP